MSFTTFSVALCFFFSVSRTLAITWSVTCFTCVPPSFDDVAIELTNDTCWKPSSDAATHTSHRSPHFSKMRGAPPSFGPTYSSTYFWKLSTLSFAPLRCTCGGRRAGGRARLSGSAPEGARAASRGGRRTLTPRVLPAMS